MGSDRTRDSVAIVIVTYQSERTIARCLEALAVATQGRRDTVVVVDNASRDGTVAIVKTFPHRFERFFILENKKNLGFAGAVNDGVRAAGEHDTILLLNPDTEIQGDVIAKTVDWMEHHPTVGVAGPLLQNADGTFQLSIRRFPTFWTIVGMGLKLHKLFPNLPVFRRYFYHDFIPNDTRPKSQILNAKFSTPIAVDQVMGAAFFVRRDCWRQLAGMDEQFFLWFEEVDFCHRAIDAGWQVMWLPFPSIRHAGGVSFGARPRSRNQLQFFTSAFQYLQKHCPTLPFGVNRELMVGSIAVGTLLQLVSFWGYRDPRVSVVGLIAVVVTTFFFSLKRPVWGVAAVMAELAMGSKGYLFALTIGRFTVSLRMGMFAVVLLAWLLTMVRQNHWERLVSFFRAMRPVALGYIAVALAVGWGIFRGILNHNDLRAVYLDANAWFFLVLLPVFLSSIKTKHDLGTLLSVLLGAITVLNLETLFLLYVFSHDVDLLLAPLLYRWVRITGLAEITQLGSSLWRIFLQSHLYSVLALFIWLAMGKKNGGGTAWLGAVFSAAALFVSLSRSFLFGFFGTAVVAGLFLLRSRAKWSGVVAYLRSAMFVVTTSIVLVFAVVRFPLPRLPSAFSSQVLADRFFNLDSEPAARSRWQLLPQLSAAVARAPVLGSGFGTVVSYTTADPRIVAATGTGEYRTFSFEWGYLDLWLKLGLGGLLVLAATMIALGEAYRETRRREHIEPWLPFLSALALTTLTMLLTHTVSPYINHPLGLGLLFFVTACIFVLHYDTVDNQN